MSIIFRTERCVIYCLTNTPPMQKSSSSLSRSCLFNSLFCFEAYSAFTVLLSEHWSSLTKYKKIAFVFFLFEVRTFLLWPEHASPYSPPTSSTHVPGICLDFQPHKTGTFSYFEQDNHRLICCQTAPSLSLPSPAPLQRHPTATGLSCRQPRLLGAGTEPARPPKALPAWTVKPRVVTDPSYFGSN